MNREDIIRMAREAGGDDWGIFRDFMPEIERFAALVAAAEREACAAQVEERWLAFEELKAAHYRQTPEPFDPFRYHKDLGTIFFSRDMAAAVRARPEHSKDKTL